MRRALLLALVVLAGCADRSPARRDYNRALAALADGRFDDAEKDFLAARDGAGGDDTLRRAAAFDLGLAYARHAESLETGEEAERAIELYRSGAAWLRDAVKLSPDDATARQALELVLRRIDAVADRLNQGDKKLEARLARLIEDQRAALTGIRGLLDAVTAAGEGREPTGFRTQFEQLATTARQLGAEAGAIADVAADEQAAIRATPDDQRAPERSSRLVQLDAVLGYLERGRQAMAETRLALRRLDGPTAHGRGDAALALTKRAAEQLLDPVAVLQRVVGDHVEHSQGTGALVALKQGSIKLDGGAVASAPAWLTEATLAAGETDAAERVREVRERLSALAAAPPAQAPDAPSDPAAERQRAAAGEAVTQLDAALTALGAATAALGKADAPAAIIPQRDALIALLAAIERFAGLRQLIELSAGEQAGAVALLQPDAPGAQPLPAAARTQRLADAATKNRDRLTRLAGLLADEVAQLDAQAAQLAQAAEAAKAQGQAAAPDAAAELDGQRQLFAAAERERAAALAAVDEMASELGKRAGGPRLKAAAERAAHHLDELRRLFFTLVERLKELRAAQGESHDGTATADAAPDEERAKTVPPLAEAEAGHAALATALAAALDQQAEAAAQAEPQEGGPDPAKQAEAMRQAAEEIRTAQTAMARAAQLLGEARDALGTQSTELTPAVTDQATALEHLDAAIRLLEPPKPQDQEDQDQKDQGQKDQGEKDQDQKDQDQQQDQQQQSAQQAERKLQEIRDREAERRRQRERQQQLRPEPVDKDW